MHYRKGNQVESLESLPMTKVSLVRHGKDGEHIWAKQGPDYIVLQNDALHFLPFESWGAVIRNPHVETIDLKDFDPEKEGIELHPDAWTDYVKDGVIDPDGLYLKRAEDDQDAEQGQNEMGSTQYTSEDIARWIQDHIEHRTSAPVPETLDRIWCRVKDKPPLQNRVDAFLHAVDNFAVPLADRLDRMQHRRFLYHLVKLWASTLVGWDAPKSEYVEQGFDVLMDYAIERLLENRS